MSKNTNVNENIIVCLLGRSGSGKTTVAEYLENNYGMKTVQSYTTRPKRSENETGHRFISTEEAKTIPASDIVAYNQYNGYEYFATAEQIDEADIYVVDVPGLVQLRQKYSGNKKIVAIGLYVSKNKAYKRMISRGDTGERASARIAIDNTAFSCIEDYCDYFLDTELADIEGVADTILNICELEKHLLYGIDRNASKIGRIDFLDADGQVTESAEYTNKYLFLFEAQEQSCGGASRSVYAYADADGEMVFDLEEVSQIGTFKVIPNPNLKILGDTNAG